MLCTCQQRVKTQYADFVAVDLLQLLGPCSASAASHVEAITQVTNATFPQLHTDPHLMVSDMAGKYYRTDPHLMVSDMAGKYYRTDPHLMVSDMAGKYYRTDRTSW